MADAPSGGGSWGTFEIVLVIILVIGLLTQLQTGTYNNSKTATSSSPTTKPITDCGLTTTRPHSLEKVTSFVTLIGTVSGCQWIPTAQTALYAQVIDAKGSPVSPYVSVPSIPVSAGVASFNIAIPLSGQPTSGKGYLILIPATPRDTETIDMRIPVTFSR